MNPQALPDSNADDVLQRLERLQHAQLAAIQSLAERMDRLAQALELDARHSLGARLTPSERGAIAQARSGATADDLVRQFNLQPADAELLVALHGRAANPASVTQFS
jgi:hypothetical protein